MEPSPQRGVLLAVIDDDDEVRAAIVDLLGEEGMAVVSAAGGREAVTAVGARRPHLVLLDYHLRDEDTVEVVARLRAAWGADVPIVLLSGVARASSAARKLGVVASLPKPCSLEQLLACITRHARRA